MGFSEILLIGIGLSMDAFAVSVCKGLTLKKANFKYAAIAGLYFGGFQFLMPVLGYLLGVRFEQAITRVDHWIAFLLLAGIGANMIRESYSKDGKAMNDDFGLRTMLLLAVATSIDALAVGVTFAFLQVQILPAAAVIGVTTFAFSAAGIYLGKAVGAKLKNYSERIGGIILIAIGLKILLEHLGGLSF